MRNSVIIFVAVVVVCTVVGIFAGTMGSGFVAGIAVCALLWTSGIVNPAGVVPAPAPPAPVPAPVVVPAPAPVPVVNPAPVVNFAAASRRLSWIAWIILLLAIFPMLVGLYSPRVKTSIERWSQNSKQAVANSLDKKSLKSEAESGVFGKITEDAVMYDFHGKEVLNEKGEIITLGRNTVVKAVDLKGVPDNGSFEGMTGVITHNPNGDFYGGNEVLVSSRKIKWGDS